MSDNSRNDETIRWAEILRHRSDPNRVVDVGPARTVLPAVAAQRDASLWHGGHAVASGSTPEAAYYDVSPLKRPVWKWQIAGYFFLGGLSSGSYLLARAAERAGGNRHRGVTRAGTWIALAAILPCPVLLIDDLGDPKRFHHMLRVFKPASPMNLGTWLVVGYSGAVAAAALNNLFISQAGWDDVILDRPVNTVGVRPPSSRLWRPFHSRGRLCHMSQSPRRLSRAIKCWLALHDVAGIPLAVGVAGYTGVLLSCTSNPLWCKNAWLGPLFSASAISTGAEAISLALDCCQNADATKSQKVLRVIDTAAHAAEVVCLAGARRSAPDGGKSLHQGSMRKVHRIALGGLIASEVFKAIPVSRKYRKPLRMLAAAAGLVAGAALRWSMVYGGIAAADDPHSARQVGRRQATAREVQQ